MKEVLNFPLKHLRITTKADLKIYIDKKRFKIASTFKITKFGEVEIIDFNQISIGF
jgi:hypothetical protein